MSEALTAAHRADMLALRRLTAARYALLWPLLDPKAVDATYPAFAVAVAGLIREQFATATALGAAYFAQARAEAGVAGAAPGERAELDERQLAVALLVTSAIAIKDAASRGTPATAAADAAFVSSAGSLGRVVENGSRDTVRMMTTTDEKSEGWTRVLGGAKPCDFCAGLADGAVLPGAVEMAAHDNDACIAEPVFAA